MKKFYQKNHTKIITLLVITTMLLAPMVAFTGTSSERNPSLEKTVESNSYNETLENIIYNCYENNTYNHYKCNTSLENGYGGNLNLGNISVEQLINGDPNNVSLEQLREIKKTEHCDFNVSKTEVVNRSRNSLCGFDPTLDSNYTSNYTLNKGTGINFKRTRPKTLNVTTGAGSHSEVCLDYRDQGIGLPPVRDQGNCGSCWAFATLAPLECNVWLKSKKKADLSEQWLVGCNTDGYDCDGGAWAHDYLLKPNKSNVSTDCCDDSGSVDEGKCPYTASDSNCDCPYSHNLHIADYNQMVPYGLRPGVGWLIDALNEHGPISVGVTVSLPFIWYDKGIFNWNIPGPINHAVTIVGYGTVDNEDEDNNTLANAHKHFVDDAWQNTTENMTICEHHLKNEREKDNPYIKEDYKGFWIIRNSWGSDWGMDGYMKIAWGCSNIGAGATWVSYLDPDLNISLPPVLNFLRGFDPKNKKPSQSAINDPSVNVSKIMESLSELREEGNNLLSFNSSSSDILSYLWGNRFFGHVTEGETANTTFEIWNGGEGTLEYSISEDCDWIDVSPTSGASTGEHDTITVSIDTTGLSYGLHAVNLSISSHWGGSAKWTGFVWVKGPKLTYSPKKFHFGKMEDGETASTTFEIWNSYAETLEYSISEDCDWIDVSPTSGASTGEHDTITVSIDTTGLSNGSYNYDILISSNDNSGNHVFPIEVKVGSVLAYSSKSFDFGMMNVNASDKTRFRIWNDGIETLRYSLSEDCDWIDVSPTSGDVTFEYEMESPNGSSIVYENDKITVSIDTSNLSVGYYNCSIKIISNGGKGIFNVEMYVGRFFYSTTSDGSIKNKTIDAPRHQTAWNACSGVPIDSATTMNIGQTMLKATGGKLKDGKGEEDYIDPDHPNPPNKVFYPEIYRGAVFFNTSSIPDDAVIEYASLDLYGIKKPKICCAPLSMIIQNGQPKHPHEPLKSIDYNRLNYHGVGGSISSSDFVTNAYNSISLNSIGKTWINKQGITKLCLRSSGDIQGFLPADTFKVSTSEGDAKPRLSIVWSYPPDKPTNSSLVDGATGVEVNPDLHVDVSNPMGNDMTVKFYGGKIKNEPVCHLIESVENIPSGSSASVTWKGLDYDTKYIWYAVADDGQGVTRSDKWEFTTTTMIDNGYTNYQLNAGWNLITPTQKIDVGDFTDDINSDGMVLKWKHGGFDVFKPGRGMNGFVMQPGHGYMVKVDEPVTASLMDSSAGGNVSLTRGWNMLGCPDEQIKASEIADSINGCSMVLKWKHGGFDVYKPGRGMSGFVVEKGEGFMVKTNRANMYKI